MHVGGGDGDIVPYSLRGVLIDIPKSMMMARVGPGYNFNNGFMKDGLVLGLNIGKKGQN